MPYYNKPNGAMIDNIWDPYSMQSIPLKDLGLHRIINLDRAANNCLWCQAARALVDALEEFVK